MKGPRRLPGHIPDEQLKALVQATSECNEAPEMFKLACDEWWKKGTGNEPALVSASVGVSMEQFLEEAWELFKTVKRRIVPAQVRHFIQTKQIKKMPVAKPVDEVEVDVEVNAMQRCSEVFRLLPVHSRIRVLKWLQDRFICEVPAAPQLHNPGPMFIGGHQTSDEEVVKELQKQKEMSLEEFQRLNKEKESANADPKGSPPVSPGNESTGPSSSGQGSGPK